MEFYLKGTKILYILVPTKVALALLLWNVEQLAKLQSDSHVLWNTKNISAYPH
jgi:hypothetical protein